VRLRLLASLAAAAALVLGALTVQPAFAATRSGVPTPGGDPTQQLSTLQVQLQQQLTTINSLADQEASEKASVDALDSKVTDDQRRELSLNQQLNRVARIEYERPALTLVTVMDARNLGQLLSGMAQARVISQQQQQLLNSATALKASDQRDQAAAQSQLDKISQQQAQATTIAASTRSEIATLQAQLAAQQAAQQAAQAQQKAATPTPTPAPSTSAPTTSSAPAAASGSVQAIIEGAFAPLGATAQQWGLCIASHESGDNPSAVQAGAGGAEGLFQFEPGTWATTPEGEAGDSIFDATASSEAAAWEYGRGNYNAWTTNADFCSMYD
jgi:hypothetical protein